MTRLLIISHETPGEFMSGPAIRYWELAQALADTLEVTLAVPAPCALTSATVRLAPYDRATGAPLPALVAQADVVLVAGFLLRRYPMLRQVSVPRVVDLYDPFLLENLVIHARRPLPEQQSLHQFDRAVLLEQLAYGDFFLCASEAQRDFWLGMLAAAGRLNPANVRADPLLRQLIDVVPFGLPATPLPAAAPVLKGLHPGIEPEARVVYWGGGVWDWFDPQTAIRALHALLPTHPNLKLFFAGVRHPNPDVPPMPTVAAVQALSHSLGLTDRAVFFNPWLPYVARAAYLREADVGLSLHFNQLETRYAYRTRLLDYVWAALPMVVTRGDELGEKIVAQQLGWGVAPGDVAGVATAITTALQETPVARAARQARAQTWAATLQWHQVVGPLREFCRAPRPAPDRALLHAPPPVTLSLLPKAWHRLRTQGLRALWQDVRLYLQR